MTARASTRTGVVASPKVLLDHFIAKIIHFKGKTIIQNLIAAKNLLRLIS